MTPVNRYAALSALKADKERELTVIKEEMATLSEQIIEGFGEDGISSVATDKEHGDKVVFVKSMLWARHLEDADATVAVLKANGYEHIVHEKVNLQTLSALVREMVADGGIPDELSGVIGTSEQVTVGVHRR